MHSLKEIQMKCSKKFTLNFGGGELSYDGGLLIIKEFLHTKLRWKIHFVHFL